MLRSESLWAIPSVLVIATVVLLVRKPDALLHPQFWAEDGTVFFLENYLYGATAIMLPYAGYLHMVPRLTAAAAAALAPPSAAPLIYNVCALVVTLVVVGSVFSKRLRMDYKPLVALAVVLVPMYQGEVFLTITNAQWILAALLVVVLMKDTPDTTHGGAGVQTALDVLAIIVCGLTGPFIVFLAPLFAFRWFRDRTWPRTLLTLAVVAVAAIQVMFLLNSSEAASALPSVAQILDRTGILVYRMSSGLFVGTTMTSIVRRLPPTIRLVPPLAAALLYVAVILALPRLPAPARSSYVNACLGVHFLMLLSVLYRLKADDEVLGLMYLGQRYFYIPMLMIAWALISLLPCAIRPIGRGAAVLLLLVLFASVTSGFRATPFVDYQWESYSRMIGAKTVDVPLNPLSWSILLPARESLPQR
jgi:hypothetical protein